MSNPHVSPVPPLRTTPGLEILERLLGHDTWTTRQLLLRCQELPDADMDREFDIALRTARATFLHLIWNMEAWTDFIADRPLRPKPGKPEDRSVAGLLRRLDAAGLDLAATATRISREGRLNDLVTESLKDPLDTKSYAGAITHVITHSMHHRAQLIYMLRRLGVQDLVEGDVLSWEAEARREAFGGVS